ncbi:MAG: DUF1501 domain-containing protein [Polyangiaceae bacterium]|nr:DUF1501 domain-containing protein [Polyangiaceae bacterium]
MKRRQLLQLGSLGALSMFLPWRSEAETGGYGGPYVIALHAAGGWDTTLFCDAKKATAKIQQNLYGDPIKHGALQIAPLECKNQGVTLDTVQNFFSDLGSRFLVVNGIDTQTNNHDTGVKHVWSGKTFEELPSIAALLAAGVAETQLLPVSYISSGGYDVTDGLVPLTRISGGNNLLRVARPSITNPSEQQANWRPYFSDATYDRLTAARATRLEQLAKAPGTPRMAESIRTFSEARAGAAGFAALANVLPAKLVEVGEAFPNLGGYNDNELERYLQAVQMALCAFKSGQATSASLATFGFDTHAFHDIDHPRQLGRLMLTIRYLMTLADSMGLSNDLYVVVGSDFGRTPTYNSQFGKDHWNVTSMLFAGPGIPGGTVIGGTDDEMRPLSVSKSNPKQLLGYDDPAGTRILPAHIQRALRKKIGISAALSDKYALPVDAPLDDMLS